MKRQDFSHCVLRLFSLQAVILFGNAAQPPNIIFFLADDLGYNDVSYHGMTEILTPNIDTLAGDSLVLNKYYVQSTCSPSRAALLTSRYPIHTGLNHLPFTEGQPYGLSTNFTLLPQYLKKRGYKTHALGKWHLGFQTKEYTPVYRGFDTHYGYWSGVVDYYQHTVNVQKPSSSFYNLPAGEPNRTIQFVGYDFHENMHPVEHDTNEHMTDLLRNRAVKIITEHDKSKPLFLYMADIAVHAPPEMTPFISPPRFKDRYPYISDRLRKNFAGELTALDESLGRIMEALYQARMMDNTIVIFSSDNGADTAIFPNGGSNYPLRGSKVSFFEGGIRAAGFVWSPLLKNNPRVSNELMHMTDWLPTLYHAAGGNVPDIGQVDGVDNWPMIFEGKPSNRKDLLINIDPLANISSYRDGDFKIILGRNTEFNVDKWFGPSGKDSRGKYVHYNNIVERVLRKYYRKPLATWKPNLSPVNCGGSPPEVSADQCMHSPCVFNLAEDPCEYHDLSSQMPEKTQELLAKMNAYRASTVQPYPTIIDYNADPLKHCGLWTPWLDADQQHLNCYSRL